MTEEAKRALALQIMEQERLRSHSPLDAARERISASLRRSEERRQSFASLAQKGNTWDELQEAYSSAYEQGKRDMVTFHLVFFYCSLALALREVFDFSSSAIKSFIGRVEEMMNDEDGREDLLTRCREQTGIDTAFADIPAIPNRSTRKDREAVNRMMRTGITSRDIELERESGYYYGRNSGFFLSAGYAGVALLLSRPSSFPADGANGEDAIHLEGVGQSDIESFLDRMEEISSEEICVSDILERAKNESGIDASAAASEANYKF